MVRMAIDCDDRDSIFEVGCALFLKAASFAKFCHLRSRVFCGQRFPTPELKNATRLQPIE
jgi:hypothetical protein